MAGLRLIHSNKYVKKYNNHDECLNFKSFLLSWMYSSGPQISLTGMNNSLYVSKDFLHEENSDVFGGNYSVQFIEIAEHFNACFETVSVYLITVPILNFFI